MRKYNHKSYLFNGRIDEVSFFNKALTDSEIAAIYNAGAGINRTVEYDYAGNLVRDGKGYMYSWDTENRLKAINKRSLTGQTIKVAEMEYDALGRRIRQVVRVPDLSGYIQTDYYYNGWQVLTEVVTDAGLDVSTVNYAYGNGLDEVLFFVTDDGTSQSTSYLVHDHLNSPAARIDSTGAILERYEYDAYGKRKVFNADYSSQLAVESGTNIGFTGQRVEYFDGGSLELCYYKNRWYSPEQGRFLSNDPLGVFDGLNMYEYVRSRPVFYVDKLGLTSMAPDISVPEETPVANNFLELYFRDYACGQGRVCRYGENFRKSFEDRIFDGLIAGKMPTTCGVRGNRFNIGSGGKPESDVIENGNSWNLNQMLGVGTFHYEIKGNCTSWSTDSGVSDNIFCCCDAKVACKLHIIVWDLYKFKDTYTDSGEENICGEYCNDLLSLPADFIGLINQYNNGKHPSAGAGANSFYVFDEWDTHFVKSKCAVEKSGADSGISFNRY